MKYVKILIVVVIIALFLWFIVLKPSYNFHKYEKELEAAAKRYYDLNYTELPTGERISKVSMLTLYHKSFLKEDFYIPYTDEPCSLTESWVKVRKDGNGYKYYTYLKCGVLESNIDSKGPKITLNGSETMTLNLGEEYKEPGIKSVVDNTDGKMDKKSVTINSKKVNINKVGVYEVEYTALDSLKNKTTITRKVQVVSKLKNAVKVATKDKGYYTGENPNNYVRLSGMLFRIVDIDGENVRVVTAKDIANVNYDGISSWLDDYFMNHIAEPSKKLLVENKYCNMTITEQNKGTTECNSFTNKRYAYIPSIVELNKSLENKKSFLRPGTLSWLANSSDDKEKAYYTRNIFYSKEFSDALVLKELKIDNYGVRPMLTIKGDTLIKKGNGTITSPYEFGDLPKAKPDEELNKRYSGEYVQYAGVLWRIVEINSDGTTKIISEKTVKKEGKKLELSYYDKEEIKKYNPKQSGNLGYLINNKVSEYIDTSYFVNKKISVPIYQKEIQYGKEISVKKYEVKISAPNMYEMFSAMGREKDSSYWLINSSETKYYKAAVSDVGVVIRGEIGDYSMFGVRAVGNLNKSVIINSGNGTEENPYTISK